MTESQAADKGTLFKLSDTDLTVADPAEDVRGSAVIDRYGKKIGKVDDLFLDDRDMKVRFLQVSHGGILGIGAEHFLVPVDAVTGIDQDQVSINRDTNVLKDAPGYDPKLAEDPNYYNGIYGWWGFGPYWQTGYSYPPYPYYRV